MTTTYEVWDMDTANQIATFDSEGEAEAFLSDMLRLNGADAVVALSIAAVQHDERGVVDQKVVIEGSAFIARSTSRLAPR